MKTFLLDVNIWIASAFDWHIHHEVTQRWFGEHSADHFAFCRTTQQGFLRLATNPKVFEPAGDDPLTLPEAWHAYDTIVQHPRILFRNEPPGLESQWRDFTQDGSLSRKLWTDAYLAAFACCADLHLVSFDGGFARFDELESTHLG